MINSKKSKQKQLNCALIQLNATDDVFKNLEKAKDFVEKAISKGARFILLPEVFTFRRQNSNINIPFDANIEKTLKPFLELALDYKVFILCGSVYEKSQSTKGFNTSLLINDQGKFSAKYQKIHLFSFRDQNKIIKESHDFKAGNMPCIASIDNRKIGMSICYDLRFPELYRLYQRLGVEIFTIPASFTKPTGEKHWQILCQARAIENQCFVLAPNQVGIGAGGIPSYGHSLAISPTGEVIAKGSFDQEEIVMATLNFEELEKSRRQIPVKDDRKL